MLISSGSHSVNDHAYLFIHLLSQTQVKLHNRIQWTDAWTYNRKKYFSVVVLLYEKRNFINILKNQRPRVNNCRKVLQTYLKAVQLYR